MPNLLLEVGGLSRGVCASPLSRDLDASMNNLEAERAATLFRPTCQLEFPALVATSISGASLVLSGRGDSVLVLRSILQILSKVNFISSSAWA